MLHFKVRAVKVHYQLCPVILLFLDLYLKKINLLMKDYRKNMFIHDNVSTPRASSSEADNKETSCF